MFDILTLDGRDLRPTVLRHRRVALEQVLAGAPALVLSQQWEYGPALFKSVVANKLEGIVGKKLDSRYEAGRSRCWLKARAPTSRPQEFR